MLHLLRESDSRRRLFGVCAAATLALTLPVSASQAAALAPCVGVSDCLVFDIELTSLNLIGGPFPMPLARDPGNALGDSVSGYGFVDSGVGISLSSQRSSNPGPASVGQAVASTGSASSTPGAGLPPIDPNALDGTAFFVDSFFDVFFDITVTDLDSRPGRDFAGQSDGASIILPGNGPAHMQATHTAIFDKNAPNFGLIPPPQADPYIGGFVIEIPLGGDINGNGENDKIKFTLVSNAVGDNNRTFTTLPDGTVINGFDSAAYLEGAVVDISTDPPFTLGTGSPSVPGFDPGGLTGPATATSKLLNPVSTVPVPGTLGLMAISVVGFGLAAIRRRHTPAN